MPGLRGPNPPGLPKPPIRAALPRRADARTPKGTGSGGRGEWMVPHGQPKKELPMLWTILIIVIIVLAVIGLMSVMRGRA